MKFQQEHYSSLKESIRVNAILPMIRNGLTLKTFKEKYYTATGLSETRFIWDLYWMSMWSRDIKNRRILSEYGYNDNHIQTAVKNILKDFLN